MDISFRLVLLSNRTKANVQFRLNLYKTLQTSRIDLDNQLRKAKEENNQLGVGKAALTATTQEAQVKIDALSKDNENLRTNHVELDNQLRKVKEENSQLGVEKTAFTATTQAMQLRIAALGKDNETLQTSQADLDKQLQKAKEENSQLVVEKSALTATTREAQARIDALSKDNELGRPAALQDIRERYDGLASGKVTRAEMDQLHSRCEGFLEKYPGYYQKDKMAALGQWAKSVLAGKVRVIPVKFVNKGYRDKKMSYSVLLGDQQKLHYEADVKGPITGAYCKGSVGIGHLPWFG
jgi:chromosome segregation ATPase